MTYDKPSKKDVFTPLELCRVVKGRHVYGFLVKGVAKTGRMAKQADGAVMVRMGDTMMLASVVSAKEAKEDVDFMPLSVDYKEKYAAAGKFPGGFLKREARPSDYEILIARLVDRALRPLFPDDEAPEMLWGVCPPPKITSPTSAWSRRRCRARPDSLCDRGTATAPNHAQARSITTEVLEPSMTTATGSKGPTNPARASETARTSRTSSG